MEAVEKVVATITTEDVEAKIVNDEARQDEDNRALQAKAASLVIMNDQQYQEAAEIGKEIKRRAKMVTDLFQPIKEAANKAHKAACAREKEMLLPLQEAERMVKASMSAYTMEQERKRLEAEETARKAREEEARRMLEQAVALDEQGDSEAAAAVLEDAQVMAETPAVAAPAVLVTKGVTQKKVWDIQIVSPGDVPVSFAGVVIRPIDIATIKKLVTASKGKMQIPGVKVIESLQTILRS